MSKDELTALLGRWEGYTLGTVGRVEVGPEGKKREKVHLDSPRKLKGYLLGILSHCRFPLHTGVLEGINNKIKVIKRVAYGFRDDA